MTKGNALLGENNRLAQSHVSNFGNVIVIRSGDNIFIRTKWDDNYDLVQKLKLQEVTQVAYTNNAVQFVSEGFVSVDVSDDAIATTFFAVTLKASSDDNCPININNTYIGANHGLDKIRVITATGHGKTNVDVGSAWTDGAATVFYIMRVVDANTLWVLSADTGVAPAWSFNGTISGSTLTHSAGATNTGDITISGTANGQLYPAIKNQVKKVYLNGSIEVAEDGIFQCDYVDIRHTYDISNPSAILDFIIANVGNAADPDFTDSSIANVARVTTTYHYSMNGACTVFTSVKNVIDVTLGYMGFVQAGPVNDNGGGLFQYIPGVSPYTSTDSYDWSAIQDITGTLITHVIDSAKWLDANKPPSRFTMFTKTAEAAKYYGLTLGFNQSIGLGQYSLRKDQAVNCFRVNVSKKMYPEGIGGNSTTYVSGAVPAGTVHDMVSFRVPENYNENPEATACGWYEVGDEIHLFADYHDDFDGFINLPAKFVGKQITTVETGGTVSVESLFVSEDGIKISVTTFGWVVLKLT